MQDVTDNNGYYDVAMQGIDRTKTGKYQEVCLYPEKEWFIYDWYRSMAYICIMDFGNDDYIFAEFANAVFKSGESKTDSRVSFMFRKIYEHFYELVQQYRIGQ